MLRFNVSEVQDYDRCPRLHQLRWIEKRGNDESAFALDLGTAVHKALRQIVIGLPRDKVVDLIGRTLENKEELAARSADLVLDHWEKVPRTWEVIAAEELMEITVTPVDGSEPFVLYGTPDLVVRWNDRIWHVQHKTLGLSRPLHTYVKEIKASLHEGLYGEMLERKYGSYAGTMLNVVRKISFTQASKDPGSGMHMEFMKISPRLRSEVLLDLQDRRDELKKAYENPTRRAYRKRKNCLGDFGNKACQAYETCHGAEPGTLGETDGWISWPGAQTSKPVSSNPDTHGVFLEGQDFIGGPPGWGS